MALYVGGRELFQRALDGALGTEAIRGSLGLSAVKDSRTEERGTGQAAGRARQRL